MVRLPNLGDKERAPAARIALGWVATPITAGVMCFFSLFVMQNVFDQRVFFPVEFELRKVELTALAGEGVPVEELEPLRDRRFASGEVFLYQVRKYGDLTPAQERMALAAAIPANSIIKKPSCSPTPPGEEAWANAIADMPTNPRAAPVQVLRSAGWAIFHTIGTPPSVSPMNRLYMTQR